MTQVAPGQLESPAVDSPSAVPLSYAQQRFWFLHTMAPDAAVHNIPVITRFAGPLQLDALRHSVQCVIARHEILRTCFAIEEGEPVQRVHSAVEVDIPLIDLAGSTEPEALMAARLERDAREPFDLGRAPLLRAAVLQLGPHEHILAAVFHHIVFDATSAVIFRREVGAAYAAARTGERLEVPPLPAQYADYARWQRAWVHADGRQGLDRWRQRLAGLQPLTLPTDRPRPLRQTFNGSALAFELGPELSHAMRQLAIGERVTPAMVALAAFALVIGAHSGRDDVAVGVPIVNRNRTELEGLIGPFLNTQVLRTSLAGNPTGRELLARVREASLDAYADQDVPFEAIVDALQPERDPSRSPLFDVMFVFQPTPPVRPGGQGRPVPARRRAARADLTLQLADTGTQFRGFFEYNTDLFDHRRIAEWRARYVRVLGALVADPAARTSAIPLLTPDERRTMLEAWTSPSNVGTPDTVVARFEQRAQTCPHADAVIGNGRSLTYANLDDLAGCVADRLVAIGARPEHVIGVALPRSPELIIALLGVLKTGASYLGLDADYSAGHIASVIAETHPSFVIVNEVSAAAAPAAVRHIVMDELLAEPASCRSDRSDSAVSRAYPEQSAIVACTAGPRSAPNAVALTHRGIAAMIDALERQLPVRPAERVMATSPAGADLGTMEVLRALCAGAVLVFPASEDLMHAASVAQTIEEAAATEIHAVPRLARMAATSPVFGAAERRILVTRDALSHDEWEAVGKVAGTRLNVYGVTEASGWSAVARVDASATPLHIGRPLTTVQMYVLDGSLNPAPVDAPGELYVAGEGLARGYLRDAAQTARRFVANPFGPAGSRMFRTGDVARWLSCGELELVGRTDDPMVHMPIRPLAVEWALRGCPDVADAVFVAGADDTGTPWRVAYVAPAPGTAPDPMTLRARLVDMVPRPYLPTVAIIDRLPLTPHLKPDVRELVSWRPPSDRRGAESRPLTTVENGLAQLWIEVLGRTNIEPGADFFRLGGQSLLAMRLLARIRRVYGVEVTIQELFAGPTIAELAALIERRILAEIEQLSDEEVQAALSGANSALPGTARPDARP